MPCHLISSHPRQATSLSLSTTTTPTIASITSEPALQSYRLSVGLPVHPSRLLDCFLGPPCPYPCPHPAFPVSSATATTQKYRQTDDDEAPTWHSRYLSHQKSSTHIHVHTVNRRYGHPRSGTARCWTTRMDSERERERERESVLGGNALCGFLNPHSRSLAVCRQVNETREKPVGLPSPQSVQRPRARSAPATHAPNPPNPFAPSRRGVAQPTHASLHPNRAHTQAQGVPTRTRSCRAWPLRRADRVGG
ncbi:hypothetical protein HDK77DRAFT_214311 [Phyllosticta capitalensis]